MADIETLQSLTNSPEVETKFLGVLALNLVINKFYNLLPISLYSVDFLKAIVAHMVVE